MAIISWETLAVARSYNRKICSENPLFYNHELPFGLSGIVDILPF